MHSRRITMSKKKGSLPVSAGSLLVLIGGVLAIASYFLGWLTFSTPQVLFIDGTSTTFTGGDVFSGFEVTLDGGDPLSIPADNMSFARLMPMLVLVFGVLGVIVSLIPMITKSCGKPIAAVQLLFGLLIIVFAAIFAFAGAGPDLFTGGIATALKIFIDMGLSISAAVGVWVGLAGGVVALIGGGLSLKDAS